MRRHLPCAVSLCLALAAAQPAGASGLVWSTFLGGAQADQAYALATDAGGHLYVAGTSSSSDFPTTPGAYDRTKGPGSDVTVTKFLPDGMVAWSTFLGGAGNEEARAIAADAAGNVYVAGHTTSGDFPVSAGAFRTSPAGGVDAFVAKLSADGGSLVYSTYLGGSWDDYPRGLAVNAAGEAYAAGFTSSSDFPTTSGVVKPTRTPVFPDGADGFITRLNASGTGLVFSTYLGTNGGTDEIFAIALDASSQPTVTGWTLSPGFPTTAGAYDRTWVKDREGFVTRLNASASGYVFSTFLGDSGRDEPMDLALDATGASYVAGKTSSTRFPTTAGAAQTGYGGGASDAFLARLSPNGSALEYSTLLGGSGSDVANSVAVWLGGEACLVGATDSGAFPVTPGAYDATANGGSDAFLTVLPTSGGALSYSTYLGAAAADYAQAVSLDTGGRAVLCGYTDSGGFPTTPGAYDPSQNGAGAPDDFVTLMDAGLGGSVGLPDGYRLSFRAGPAWPNPSAGPMRVGFALERGARVRFRVLDLQGRVVHAGGESDLPAGSHVSTWDGRDDAGHETETGVYYLELTAGGQRVARAAVRIR